MDSSSGQTQQMSSQSSLENMLGCSKAAAAAAAQQDRKPRPQPEQAQKCPRCDSTNTKFCYYNNYSLSQPRYFCKSCRRYWTKGGTLRNVPVGGGCRKNKRSSSSSSTSSSSSKRTQDQTFTPNLNPFNNLPPHSTYDSSDFTLALARLQKQHLSYDDHDLSIMGNPTNSFCNILGGNSGMNLDALRTGFLGGNNGAHYNNNNNNVQSMYGVYNGNGDNGEVNSGNNSGCGEMMMVPYEQEMISNVGTHQAMKQEFCSGREQSESKVLGGFTWQQLNGGTNMGEIDSGRASWNNGFTSSNWHGLLHSPLM